MNFSVTAALKNGAVCSLPFTFENGTLTVRKEDLPEGAVIDVKSAQFSASTNDEGYIVCSGGAADGDFLCPFVPRNEAEWVFNRPMMPLFGIKTKDFCAAQMVLGGNLEESHVIRVENGVYSVFARFEPAQPLNEDIVIRTVILTGSDADYAGMARAYRNERLARGDIRLLRDRAKDNPLLGHAADTLFIRIRQGWKPVPSPVKEQTVETEPPMHVAMTFDRDIELLNAMKAQGIEDADICLVGWNRKGHDGRYPQMFPVEPELGGEERLRALIERAHELGYSIDCHTNSTDAYHIADCFDERELMYDREQRPVADAYGWSAGRMYHLCGIPGLARAKTDLPKVAELGFKGLHYIDVFGSEWPRDCFNPLHPRTKRDTLNDWLAIMNTSKAVFGGISIESSYDCFAPAADYILFEGRNLLGELPEAASRRVPLWSLVYHGIILGNPSGETLNYGTKSWRERLKCHEYGGRPSIYFHLAFTGDHWQDERDFTCTTDADLEKSVRDTRAMYDDFEALKHLQTLLMQNHEQLAEDVARVTYEDGEQMILNYSDKNYVYAGETVPAHDLRLFEGVNP